MAQAFGGSIIDGFRLGQAIALAGAGAFFALAATHLSRSTAIAAALTAAYVAAFVQLYTVAILQWNVEFLLPAVFILWIAVSRSTDWRLRHSIASGLAGAAAMLIAWQALPYLFAGGYAALLGGNRRSFSRRVFDAALVVVAFIGGLVAFCGIVAITSERTFVELLRVLVASPTPTIMPETKSALLARILDLSGGLHTIGVAVNYMLHHELEFRVPTWRFGNRLVGLLTVLGVVVIFVLAQRRARRQQRLAPHLLSVLLMIMVALTSIVRQPRVWDYTLMKRFNFLPLLLGLLAADFLAGLADGPRRRRMAIATLFAVIAVIEVALFVRFSDHWLARRPELPTYLGIQPPEDSWYGRGGKSWFAYFRELRRQHPNACRFVFAFAEIQTGQWNFDIPASLYSELPSHLVVGVPASVAQWRYPPHVMTAQDIRARNLGGECAWISRDARVLLAP